MRSSRQIARWCFLIVGATGFCCAPDAVWAQDLKKKYDENAPLRDQLFSGETPANPKTKSHLTIAQASAEYFILRVARKEGELDKLQKEFAANIGKLMDKKNVNANAEFRKLYGVALVGTIKTELAQDIKAEPSTTIHLALMLPIMARLKHPYVSENLIALIEDNNTHDAVRLYALKALKDTMPIEAQVEEFPKFILDFKDKGQNAKREHDIKNVETLSKYIERAINPDKMSPDELATMRFLRREAIVSLASAGTPAVYAFPKGKNPAKGVPEMGGPIAPTLLKVLIKGAIQPEPAIQEKIEAALGLCAMDYTNMPEYLPDAAIYLVGLTIIDFASEYNQDRANFVQDKGKKAPFVAWKTDAKRFQAGLTQLKDSVRGNPAAAKAAAELQIRAKFLLDKMEKYQDVDQPRLQDCIREVGKMRPKDGKVFKTLNVPALHLP